MCWECQKSKFFLRTENRRFTSDKAHRACHLSTPHSAHSESASLQIDRPIALCQHLVWTPDSNAETAALVVCGRPSERLSQAPFSFLPSLVASTPLAQSTLYASACLAVSQASFKRKNKSANFVASCNVVILCLVHGVVIESIEGM